MRINGESLTDQQGEPNDKDEPAGKELSATYCKACRKDFSNQNVYDHHLKGKRHLKSVA